MLTQISAFLLGKRDSGSAGKRFFRAALILLAVLLVLGLGVIVGLHQYLRSAGGQARLQKELSRALRMPITFKEASLSGSHFRISELTIRDRDTTRIEVAAIYARYRPWPLLRGVVRLYDLSVEKPKLVLNQKPREKKPKREKPPATPTLVAEVKAPAPPVSISTPAAPIPARPPLVEPAPPKPAEPAPAPIAAAPAPTTPAESKAKPAKSPARKKSPFQLVVESGQLRHGSVQIIDETLRPIGVITEINFDCTSQPSGEAKALLEVERIVWASIVVEKLRIPITFAQGKLELPEVTGKFGDGPFLIRGSWEPHHPESPVTLAIRFDQVDLDRLTRDTDEPLGLAFGTLSGTAELAGSSKAVESIQGNAALVVRDGRLRDFAYCTMIGQPLGIDQFDDLKFAESSAKLRVADGQVFIEDVLIDASDLQVKAKGFIQLDGRVQAAARLTATDSVVDHVPSATRPCWTSDGGAHFIDFKITGKTHKPKTDLPDIVSRQMPGTPFDDLVALILEAAKKKAAEAKAKGR